MIKIGIIKLWSCSLVVLLLGLFARADKQNDQLGTVTEVSVFAIDVGLLLQSPRVCCRVKIRAADTVYSIVVKGTKAEFGEWLASSVRFRVKNHRVVLWLPNGKEVSGDLREVASAATVGVGEATSATFAPRSDTVATAIPIDLEVLTANKDCALLSATLESDNFFKDFRSKKSIDVGRTFRNVSGSVNVFPDRMTLKVQISTIPCIDKELHDGLAREFEFDDRSLLSATFKGFWKAQNTFDTRDVELRILSQVQTCPPSILSVRGCTRAYELDIRSEGVPLTDALVICMFSTEGKLLTRFSTRF